MKAICRVKAWHKNQCFCELGRVSVVTLGQGGRYMEKNGLPCLVQGC